MRIALIYLPIGYYSDSTILKAYVKNIGLYPPLSLAYVAAAIKKSEHEVTIIDANALHLNMHGVNRKIKEFSPDLLGLTVTANTFHETLYWIKQTRRYADIPVLLGGQLIELYPKEIMSHKEVDFAFMGYANTNLINFFTEFINKKKYNSIPGLCFRQGDDVIINEKSNCPDYFVNLDPPARELLPNDKYFSIFTARKNFTALLTSKGCKFKCKYCPQGEKLQLRDSDKIVDEISDCYNLYGIREIDFYDSVFTVDRNRTLDIIYKIMKRKIKISYVIRSHLNTVDKELLAELSKSGCKAIIYGIESSHPEILKELNRPVVDKGRIKEIIKMTKSCNMFSIGFFMLGSPGENKKSIAETIRFSKELDLDFAQFTKITPFPRTELYEMHLNKYKVDYWRIFVLSNNYKIPDFPLINTDLNSVEVLRYVKKAYLSFYFRISYLIKMLSNSRSLRQICRYIKGSFDILIS